MAQAALLAVTLAFAGYASSSDVAGARGASGPTSATSSAPSDAATSSLPKAHPQVIEPIPGVESSAPAPGSAGDPVGDANAHAPTLAQVKHQLQLEQLAGNPTATSPSGSSSAASTSANQYFPAADPLATGPFGQAHINSDGTASAPADAPPVVQAVIAAANQIIDKPYIYAGGHGSWVAPGYDCSGAVSYALHGAGLLSAPLAVQFEGYGSPGPGQWITIYADSQHVFAAIAGLAFDTADWGGPNIPAGSGPRWRYNPTGNLADGGDYVVRHPPGL